LYRDAGGWKPLPANYAAEKPAMILLEDIEKETSGAVVAAAVHGAIRCGKVMFANGAPANTGAADDLRMAGIYLLGDPAPSAEAPAIVENLSDKSVAPGTPLTLSFLVAARDEGIITWQWYSNTGASTSGGTPITGATGENYTVDTSEEETLYFYCVATSHLNNTEAPVTSAACTVTVA
ncbi:MAG: hypothetical protein LBK02_07790, partial [Treponema sp.]|nr:hypothetical protein [Treponema sp.]